MGPNCDRSGEPSHRRRSASRCRKSGHRVHQRQRVSSSANTGVYFSIGTGAIFATPGDIRDVPPRIYMRRKGAATNEWRPMLIVAARMPGCISSANRDLGPTAQRRRRRAGEGYSRRQSGSLFPEYNWARRVSTAIANAVGPDPGI